MRPIYHRGRIKAEGLVWFVPFALRIGAPLTTPGDPVPMDELREFHLRSLYRRGIVGYPGEKYGEDKIARWKEKLAASAPAEPAPAKGPAAPAKAPAKPPAPAPRKKE